MIAYDELVRALDSWRIRNGLPVSTTEVPANAPRAAGAPSPSASSSASLPAAAPAPYRPTMPMPAPTPNTYAAPTAPRPVSTTAIPTTESDVLSLEDADVDADADGIYDNDGNDFAMSFGASSAPQPAPVGNPVGAVSGSIGGGASAEPDFYDDEAFGDGAHTQAVAPDEIRDHHAMPAPLSDPMFDDGHETHEAHAHVAHAHDGHDHAAHDAAVTGEAFAVPHAEDEEDEEAVWLRLRSRVSEPGEGEADETVVGDDHKR